MKHADLFAVILLLLATCQEAKAGGGEERESLRGLGCVELAVAVSAKSPEITAEVDSAASVTKLELAMRRSGIRVVDRPGSRRCLRSAYVALSVIVLPAHVSVGEAKSGLVFVRYALNDMPMLEKAVAKVAALDLA